MPKGEETSSTLVLVDARVTEKRLASLQKKTAKQVALIGQAETENVNRRLAVGVALEIIKESFGHGNGWTPWTEAHVLKKISQRQMHLIMAAGRVFIEHASIKAPDLAALTGGKLSLNVKDGPMKKLAAAAADFVGDRTWGELLADYEIKDAPPSLGGARPRGATKVKAQSAEQLYLFARGELGSLVETAERVIVKENLLQHMAEHPEEAIAAIESLEVTLKKAKEAAKAFLKK